MSEKGQITTFIILGILIVAIFAIGVYYSSSRTTEDVKSEEQSVFYIEPIKNYIDSCLEKSLENTISYVSLQGGYYDTPERPVKYHLGLDASVDIPYYMYSENLTIPDEDKVREQLEKGVSNSFLDCLDFSPFPYSVDVKEDRLRTRVSFSKDKVEAEVFLPIEVKKGVLVRGLERFSASTDSKFNDLYTVAKDITMDQFNSDGRICLSCVRKQAIKSDTSINFFEIEANSDVYILTRENSIDIYDAPADKHHSTLLYLITKTGEDGDEIFAFAHKYDLSAK